MITPQQHKEIFETALIPIADAIEREIDSLLTSRNRNSAQEIVIPIPLMYSRENIELALKRYEKHWHVTMLDNDIRFEDLKHHNDMVGAYWQK